MAEVRDVALLLRRIPYSESSLVLHVLTASHGRIALMAKGARRAKSPLRAALMEYCILDVRWREGRTGMGLLLDVSRQQALLAESRWLAGMELQAVASSLFKEGDIHGFEELSHALQMLEQRDVPHGLLAALWYILQSNGWIGDMQHCWHCGAAQDVQARMYWQSATLLCHGCGGHAQVVEYPWRQLIAQVPEDENMRMSLDDLRLWKQLILSVLASHRLRWQSACLENL